MTTQFSSSFAKLGSPGAQATKFTLLSSIQLENKMQAFSNSPNIRITGYSVVEGTGKSIKMKESQDPTLIEERILESGSRERF